MTLRDRIEEAKPYVWGFVAGFIVAPVVGFSFDWVVTTGTMKEAVVTAKIEQLAAVCAGNATAYWTSQDKEMAALDGWENREQRQTLAKQFAAELPGIESIQDDVVDECDDLLET